MIPKNFFEGFGEEKQKEYEQEIRRRYGEASVKESADRWGRYTPEKEKIKTGRSYTSAGPSQHWSCQLGPSTARVAT